MSRTRYSEKIKGDNCGMEPSIQLNHLFYLLLLAGAITFAIIYVKCGWQLC